MIRFTAIATVLAILSGCASTAVWRHPARAGDGHDGATMALAECESYAAGLTPMPRMQGYVQAPAPTSYDATGTYRSYGSYGTFQGTMTPSSTFASRYAAGANAGADIANAFAAAAANARQEKLTQACMQSLGWIDTSVPEGQERFKNVTAAKEMPKKAEASKSADDQWRTTIHTFLDTEAAREGGIDYRADDKKSALLDKYVRELGHAPENNDKSMAWFLIEAHKRVLRESK